MIKIHCEAVVQPGPSFRAYPCPTTASVHRDGKWLCKTHDPVTQAERKAQRGPNKKEREEAERKRLRDFAEGLTWLDAHGCVTGDCPHEHDGECAVDVRKELERIAGEAKAALNQESVKS